MTITRGVVLVARTCGFSLVWSGLLILLNGRIEEWPMLFLLFLPAAILGTICVHYLTAPAA